MTQDAAGNEAHAVDPVSGRDTIAGFQLMEEVGRGAMGVVYKAKQLSLGRVVALKVLDPALARDAAYVKHFLDDARAVARLSHTNLISGIDVGEENGVYYLAMEYADGVPLELVLRRGGAMDEERAVLVAQQVARALEYAHKNGAVHGAVRPANVIVTGDGVAKLRELGQVHSHEAAAHGGEDAGHASGDYTSPEVLRGLGPAGPASDLYALGCMLYRMLVGEVPFPAPNRQVAAARHLTEAAPSVRDKDGELSEEVAAIVARLLEKDPAARFPSATEAAGALEETAKRLKVLRAGSRAPAPPRAPAAAGPKPRRRRRRR